MIEVSNRVWYEIELNLVPKKVSNDVIIDVGQEISAKVVLIRADFRSLIARKIEDLLK